MAIAACFECHDDLEPRLVPGKRFHRAPGARRGAVRASIEKLQPYCRDCHGDPHAIVAAETLSPRERRLRMNRRCLGCHSDSARMKRAGIAAPVAVSYEDSMHARMLALGSEAAPGCVDCHGAHALGALDAAAMAARCAVCHEGAGADFATLVSHAPVSQRPASYYTQKLFAWLTFVTILLLAGHILLDLGSTVVRGLRGEGGQERGR